MWQGNKEMESDRDFGRVDTLRGYLCYESTHCEDFYTAGWNYTGVYAVNDVAKDLTLFEHISDIRFFPNSDFCFNECLWFC